MRILIGGIVLAFTLVCGILVGIRWDWSTWLKSGTTQLTDGGSEAQPLLGHKRATFEVETFGQAELVVSPGEILSLRRFKKGDKLPLMEFESGESPCVEPDLSSNICTIQKNNDGVFYFHCNPLDPLAPPCPDPAVVVRTSPPFQTDELLHKMSYPTDLADVLMHVFRNENSPALKVDMEFASSESGVESGSTAEVHSAVVKATALAAPLSAHIACNTKTKYVDVIPIAPPGNANDTISVPLKSTLTWQANKQFTVTFNPPASYPCKETPPFSSTSIDDLQQVTCTVSTVGVAGESFLFRTLNCRKSRDAFRARLPM